MKLFHHALLGSALAFSVAVAASLPHAAEEEEEAADEAQAAVEENDVPVYTVEDGRVDAGTAHGYMVYTGVCMPCHGPDGVGSSFAPSLVRAAERRTYEQMYETIRDGRSLLPGQVMPPFGEDENVMEAVPDIYRYLKARADGELGRGRPQLLEDGG
jgi:mono/diheme cytochrome c family protein